jgi:hypothetical protein
MSFGKNQGAAAEEDEFKVPMQPKKRLVKAQEKWRDSDK